MDGVGGMRCRACGSELDLDFVDLGSAPPSNEYLRPQDLDQPEAWYPLRVLVCEGCWLVQTEDFARFDDLFSDDYAYFSAFSSVWVDHCTSYANRMVTDLGLDHSSTVVEVAANDGTLLRQFADRGIGCLGIEPTASTAAVARSLGLEVVQEFLTVEVAERLRGDGVRADLLAANNVLAHVPDIVGFATGCRILLVDEGLATFEFPHLLELVRGVQFDTIYHEHFSYLSLTAVASVFRSAGLQVVDVERLPTHGGSLRVHARPTAGSPVASDAVGRMLAEEDAAGMSNRDFYGGFQEAVGSVRDGLLRFLLEAREDGRSVAAYGAAAKGNTLLNFAGVRPDLVGFVVDRNPAKQGLFLPGSRIPIVDEERLRAERPDEVLILPWNLAGELVDQLAYVHDWGGSLVTAVPEVRRW